jgi:hypothetical protein
MNRKKLTSTSVNAATKIFGFQRTRFVRGYYAREELAHIKSAVVVTNVLMREWSDWSFEVRGRGEDVINEGVMGERKKGIVHQEG